MVIGEHLPDLVVRKEQNALRLAAQRDRHAKHGTRVQRAVDPRLVLHRLHHRGGGAHHVAADVAAQAERQALRGAGVGAETTFEHQPARVFEGETADLRGRSLGRAGEHLLQDLVQVEG